MRKHMIKGIIFDFNGVIEADNFHPILEKHALKHGYERDRLKKFMSEYFRGAFVGEYKTLEEFFAKKKPSVEVTLEEANEAITELRASQQVDLRMIKLIEELKTKYKIGLLSNYSSALENRLKNIFKIYHLFDCVANSHDTGLRKPEPESFQYVLEKLGIKAEEAVFIDDLEENIRGAEAVGIKGILHRNFEQTEKELRKILG